MSPLNYKEHFFVCEDKNKNIIAKTNYNKRRMKEYISSNNLTILNEYEINVKEHTIDGKLFFIISN